jgi:hypothetical protein
MRLLINVKHQQILFYFICPILPTRYARDHGKKEKQMKCPLQQAFCFSNPLLVTCPPHPLEIFCQCFKAQYVINKQIKDNHPARE